MANAKSASPPPTEAELAKARLLVARSDKAKKTRKSKGNCKGANLDQDSKVKKKKTGITVTYVIPLDNHLSQLIYVL